MSYDGDAVVVDNMTIRDSTEVHLKRVMRLVPPTMPGWYYARPSLVPAESRTRLPIPMRVVLFGEAMLGVVGGGNGLLPLDMYEWFGPVPTVEIAPC